MLRSGAKGKTHAERLDNFYSGQAKGYDDFRKRLLKGREELWAALANPEVGGGVPEGGVWVDFGGGTGANLERFAEEDRKKLKKMTEDFDKMTYSEMLKFSETNPDLYTEFMKN